MDNSASSLFVAISQKLQLKQHFTLVRNLSQLDLWAPVNSELMVELVNIFFCCTYFGVFKESYIVPTWMCLYSLLQGFQPKKWCIFFFKWPLSLHPKHPQKLIRTVFPCAFLACGNGYFLIFLTMCLKQYNAHLQTPQTFCHILSPSSSLFPQKMVSRADQLVLMTPSHLILGSGPIWYW